MSRKNISSNIVCVTLESLDEIYGRVARSAEKKLTIEELIKLFQEAAEVTDRKLVEIEEFCKDKNRVG